VALTEIQAAIDAIKVAAKQDGKNLQDHPHADGVVGDKGKLVEAIKFLNKAHNDVTAEEDNPESMGQRTVVLQHLDAALAATQQARALAVQNQRH
jgi:transcriptional regulator of acetoin/glycerol metabolism